MPIINKIAFTGESTNLLKNFTPKESSVPQIAPQVNDIKQPADTFESQQSGKKSFLKEYAGIIALGLSAIGIPVTFIVTKHFDNKSIKKIERTLQELTQKLEASNKVNAPQRLVSKKSNLVTILLGIGTGAGIGEFIKNNRQNLKDQGFNDDEITDAVNTASNIVDTPKNAMEKANSAYEKSNSINDKVEDAQRTANSAKSSADSMNNKINEINNKVNEATIMASNIKPEARKFFEQYYDLWLMKYPGWETKINNLRSKQTMNSINNAAIKRLDRPAAQTLKDIKDYKAKYNGKLTSLWALTAEFKPIKLGGLGDVPVDLQDNFTKLGIDNPTFIPMYEAEGKSKFTNNGDGTYDYQWDKKNFKLERLADLTVTVSNGSESNETPVEFYQSVEDGKKLIFVKSNYFKGNIYESTLMSDEPEKFAIFNKAVYMLAKSKVSDALNEKLSAPTKIHKYSAYSKLQAPNSMILNDWHAATMAGLLRYRAPMEYNYNEINNNVFDALSNMPLLMIGHNLKVQGASNSSNNEILAKNNITQDMINTLYDKYALGIVSNAHSGLENEDLCNTILLKRTTSDKQLNSLFHGIALADWFVPVSKNYSNEVVKDVNQSGITQPLLERRKATKTLEGIINGTDKIKHDMHAIANNNRVENLVFEIYDKHTDIEKIMQFRQENKNRFYNTFLKPILAGNTTSPELIGSNNITEKEFMDAPLISFAHRLTDQKGLVLLKGAIFRLCDNWQELFPEEKMPFFLIGGPPESEQEVGYLYDLKNPDYGVNKDRINHVIALKGNMPNPAIMASSTYFCAPSTFEPCGLTQGECFAKGTPIIATNTGGYHDTVQNGKTGFLANEISEEAVYNTLVKALKVYYNEPETYKEMIKNDLEIDFSWARPNKTGPIYEYTNKLGFNTRKLKDIASSN